MQTEFYPEAQPDRKRSYNPSLVPQLDCAAKPKYLQLGFRYRMIRRHLLGAKTCSSDSYPVRRIAAVKADRHQVNGHLSNAPIKQVRACATLRVMPRDTAGSGSGSQSSGCSAGF